MSTTNNKSITVPKINLGGMISSKNIPTADARELIGGYASYNKREDLDNIPPTRLLEGKLAYCADTEKFYMYNSGQWHEKQLGGGNGGSKDGSTNIVYFKENTWYYDSETNTPPVIPSISERDAIRNINGEYRYITNPNDWHTYISDVYSTGWKDTIQQDWKINHYIWAMSVYVYDNGHIHWSDLQNLYVADSLKIGQPLDAYCVSNTEPILNNDVSNIMPPTGWSDTYDGMSEDSSIWRISASGIVENHKITKFISPWTKPIRINGGNGRPGEDGTSYEYIYARTKSDIDKPSIIFNDITSDLFQTTDYPVNSVAQAANYDVAFSGSYVSKWFDHPQGVTEKYPYEWIAIRTKNVDASDNIWHAFTVPTVWSKFGADGKDADGLEYIFTIRDSSLDFELNPPYKNPVTHKTDVTIDSDVYQTDDFVPEGWYDNPISLTYEHPYEFVSTRIKDKNGKYQKFSKPALWAQKGEKGDPGDKQDVYKFLVQKGDLYVDAKNQLHCNVILQAIHLDSSGGFVVINPKYVDLGVSLNTADGSTLSSYNGNYIENWNFKYDSSETSDNQIILSFDQYDKSNVKTWGTIDSNQRIVSIDILMYLKGTTDNNQLSNTAEERKSLLEDYRLEATIKPGVVFEVADDKITAAIQDASGDFNKKISDALGSYQTIADASAQHQTIIETAKEYKRQLNDASGRISTIEADVNSITTSVSDLSSGLSSWRGQTKDSIWDMVDTSLGKSGIKIDQSGVTITGTMKSSETGSANKPYWELDKNGAGWLGNGAIQWDNQGNVTLGDVFQDAINNAVPSAIKVDPDKTYIHYASAQQTLGTHPEISAFTIESIDAAIATLTSSKRYIWTISHTTYTDDSSINTFSAMYYPADGGSGTSIDIIENWVEYAIDTTSNPPTQTPSSLTYQTEVPTVSQGDWLWTWSHTKYSDGNSNDIYNISRIGADGIDGDPGGDGSSTHFAYANFNPTNTGYTIPYSSNGNQISLTNFNGASYLGTYTWRRTSTEPHEPNNGADSTNSSDYNWTKIQGPAGSSTTGDAVFDTLVDNGSYAKVNLKQKLVIHVNAQIYTVTGNTQVASSNIHDWTIKLDGNTITSGSTTSSSSVISYDGQQDFDKTNAKQVLTIEFI